MKEKRVLDFLKNGEFSQSKISVETGIQYDVLKIILKKLEEENKIQSRKSKFGTYIYWRLKK